MSAGKGAWACALGGRRGLLGSPGLCAGQAAVLAHPLQGPDILSPEAGPEHVAYIAHAWLLRTCSYQVYGFLEA